MKKDKGECSGKYLLLCSPLVVQSFFFFIHISIF